MSVISFEATLTEKVGQFCDKAGFIGKCTCDLVVQLLDALSTYKEEGQALTPEVIVVDDFQKLGLVLPNSSHCVGEGELNRKTLLLALKRCAPLAIGGWVAYLHFAEDRLHYGVISKDLSPVSTCVQGALIVNKNLKALFLSQLAENVVLLQSSQGDKLEVIFSSSSESLAEQKCVDTLVEHCVSGLIDDDKAKVEGFLVQELTKSIKMTHGTLIAVLRDGQAFPSAFIDGANLAPPISLSESFEELYGERDDNFEPYAKLLANSNLLKGVLSCDGITLMNSKAEILGYNIFYSDDSQKRDEKIVGGARRRAFKSLEKLVPDVLSVVFMSSHDGAQLLNDGGHDE